MTQLKLHSLFIFTILVLFGCSSQKPKRPSSSLIKYDTHFDDYSQMLTEFDFDLTQVKARQYSNQDYKFVFITDNNKKSGFKKLLMFTSISNKYTVQFFLNQSGIYNRESKIPSVVSLPEEKTYSVSFNIDKWDLVNYDQYNFTIKCESNSLEPLVIKWKPKSKIFTHFLF